MLRRRNRWILWATVATALSRRARAIDHVSYPYRGVVHTHRVANGLDAHVLTVDLASGQIDVVATRPRERSSTVSMFAREQDAQIAINANFYDASACGLTMGDGHVWRDAVVDQYDASIAFGPAGTRGWRAAVFDSEGWSRQSPVSWATQIVSGWPILLQQGAVYFDEHEPNGMYRTHPRTAIGIAADGSTLIVAVIDGRRAGLPGVTSLEMIPLLEEFGARDAINLDGGGSSEMWIGSEGGVVNRPSDGRERVVMNHLGFRITAASGAPSH
jgi:exopolysaccharide biosynthesis protein